MKKIFVLFVSVFILLAYNSNALTHSIKKPSLRTDVESTKIKEKKVVQPSVTIGFMDVCGHCWEYTFAAETWDQVWAGVNLYSNIYELGFCGYLVPVV